MTFALAGCGGEKQAEVAAQEAMADTMITLAVLAAAVDFLKHMRWRSFAFLCEKHTTGKRCVHGTEGKYSLRRRRSGAGSDFAGRIRSGDNHADRKGKRIYL